MLSRSPFAGLFSGGCVAADHPLASQAGAEILAQGGNAVDAAIATSFALSLVRPYSCGLGGGGFMLIHLAPHSPGARPGRPSTIALDYRETAPAAATPDMFEDDADPMSAVIGGKSVGVPGHVVGMAHAAAHFGTMPLDALVEPAIRLAHSGMIVDAHQVEQSHDVLTYLRADPARRSRYAFASETLLNHLHPRPGDFLALPQQAAVLRLIQRHGVEGFTTGPVARAIVSAVQADGGILTLDDLARYTVRERLPLQATLAGKTCLCMPPPSSGGIALAMLGGILDARPDLSQNALTSSRQGDASAYFHLLAEAFRHVFADRARWMGDGDFTKVPTECLLDSAYIRDLASRLRDDACLPDDSCGSGPDRLNLTPPGRGTSHICVVDRHGSAVACSETINDIWGSLVVPEGLGFCLNDTMDDFTTRLGRANNSNLVQAESNRPLPGKRPLSSMTPTIVLDDSGVAAIAGGSGGPRIISATAQVLLNTLMLGLPADDAVRAPRIHHQWQPATLYAEPPLDSGEIAEGLKRRGHVVQPRSMIGCVQLIARQGRAYAAACDPRKGGRPAGPA